MTAKRSSFPCPQVMRPMDAYRSPVNGELIQSRREKELDHVRTDTMPTQDVLVKERHSRPIRENGDA